MKSTRLMKRIPDFSLLLFIILLISINTSFAQLRTFGAATDLGNRTYQLTSDELFKSGSVWSTAPQSLAKDFIISGEMYFGNDSLHDGADGIVFVMQNNCINGGTDGGGIGYKGLNHENGEPSLGIEFDTYQNIEGDQNYEDPEFDHVAIQKEGSVDHGSDSALVQPIALTIDSSNVENGDWYNYQIIWKASNQLLEVYFNDHQRIAYTIDLVNTIFKGDSIIYWGFTSATGGSYSPNTVKINPTEYFNLENPKICLGDTAFIELPTVGGNDILSIEKPVAVSSHLNNENGTKGENVNDNESGSRWISADGDTSWVRIDLENEFDITNIRIRWETASAADYQIQVSNDTINWTTIQEVIDAPVGHDTTFPYADLVPLIKAQYVRIYMTKKATGWNYSIFDFEVYGIINYIWSPASAFEDVYSSSQQLAPTSTTTYSVRIPDKCNEQVDIDFTVFVDDINASLSSDLEICESDTLLVNANVTGAIGNVTYHWTPIHTDSSSFVLIPPYSQSTYNIKLVAQGELECSIDSSEITIAILNQKEFNSAFDFSLCLDENGFVTFKSINEMESEISNYTWYLNDTPQAGENSIFTFSPTIGDEVFLEIQSNTTCLTQNTALSDTVTMEELSSKIIADAGESIITTSLDEINLDGSNTINATTYEWTKIISESTSEFIDTTTQVTIIPTLGTWVYQMKASNKYCPSDFDTLTITFNNPDIEIPNVFSPNNDDSHDKWVIKNSESFNEIIVKVFNRWGSLIFEGEKGNYNNYTAWDGTYNGEPLPVGTYYYIVDLNIDRAPYKGSVTILR